MEIRDPVHGSITISKEIEPIIQADFFQRLRNIKQLGFSEYVFPGATHTRFLHSIGVMHIGSKAFNKILGEKLANKDVQRIKETFKLACLLHDIGHGPLSHSTETVMPKLSELEIPKEFLSEADLAQDRQATHEDYTIKAIADSSFASSFKDVEGAFNVDRRYIADLIVGRTKSPDYFMIDGVNYFPLLHQLVSSELDCDRMDYLLRDSYFCGVSYGNYDLDWLLENLNPAIIDGIAYLGISERAVVTFDDFLLSRYHMFIMVYFHYKAVCLEQLLYRYFKTEPQGYKIPANIEEYIQHDDHFLMKILRNSKNEYAQAIVKNQIPKKIFESFNPSQMGKFEQLEEYLTSQDVEVIRCSSAGRLSKYYAEGKARSDDSFSMKVIRKIQGTDKVSFTDINEATDLFQKFATSHSINRLHCNLDETTQEIQDKVNEIILS